MGITQNLGSPLSRARNHGWKSIVRMFTQELAEEPFLKNKEITLWVTFAAARDCLQEYACFISPPWGVAVRAPPLLLASSPQSGYLQSVQPSVTRRHRRATR